MAQATPRVFISAALLLLFIAAALRFLELAVEEFVHVARSLGDLREGERHSSGWPFSA
jgi:hypothetical protein